MLTTQLWKRRHQNILFCSKHECNKSTILLDYKNDIYSGLRQQFRSKYNINTSNICSCKFLNDDLDSLLDWSWINALWNVPSIAIFTFLYPNRKYTFFFLNGRSFCFIGPTVITRLLSSFVSIKPPFLWFPMYFLCL